MLVALIDVLRRQLDRDESALLLLLGLMAVFNTVDFNLLTHCLTNVGVCGVALQWLTSFFQGQGQWEVLGERMYSLVSRCPKEKPLSYAV